MVKATRLRRAREKSNRFPVKERVENNSARGGGVERYRQ
jgi:hypothetical protein